MKHGTGEEESTTEKPSLETARTTDDSTFYTVMGLRGLSETCTRSRQAKLRIKTCLRPAFIAAPNWLQLRVSFNYVMSKRMHGSCTWISQTLGMHTLHVSGCRRGDSTDAFHPLHMDIPTGGSHASGLIWTFCPCHDRPRPEFIRIWV